MVPQQRRILPGGPRSLRGVFFLLLGLLLATNSIGHPNSLALDPSKSESLAQVQRLEQRLKRNPEDAFVATRLAHHYLHRHRAESGGKWIDQADAILAPWVNRTDAPPILLLELADLQQRVHRFEPALRTLNALLQATPDNAQAVLSRSTILTVLGRYDEATLDNKKLAALAEPHVITVNRCAIDSLSGKAKQSLDDLEVVLARPSFPDNLRPWTLGIAGDIAVRLGLDDRAEEHFLAGLKLAPKDTYLLTALADLLLATDRPEDVLQRIPKDTPQEGLRLRRILATPSDDPKRADLVAAFDARLKSDHARAHPHLREEAMFALDVLDDPERALRQARANWATQREPADLLIYVRALQSQPAGSTTEELPDLHRWFRERQMEWPALERLLSKSLGSISDPIKP